MGKKFTFEDGHATVHGRLGLAIALYLLVATLYFTIDLIVWIAQLIVWMAGS